MIAITWCASPLTEVYAQAQQRITLDLRQASAEQMLNALKESTRYEFFYRLNDLEEIPRRDYQFTNATLESVMDRLVAETAFQWSLQNGTVTISRRQAAQQNQSAGVITGRVTDENGIPVLGASVALTGTPRGVITNANGEFRIDRITGSSASVRVSFVGMEIREQTVTVGSPVTIVLRPDVKAIENVVVTGLFDRPGDSFTGAATTIRGEQLALVGSTNIFQALRNIDASLSIMDNLEFGSDPNRMPEIELRGTSVFPLPDGGETSFRRMYENNPNQPLFILDGFETTITRIFDLDMSRVESITILKDAAAKAIYGAKAANGVVVIETTRSRDGSFRISYRGSVDITVPDLTSYNLTNSLEKLEVERLSGVYGNWQLGFQMRDEELYNYRLNLALSGLNTDWLSKPLRTGVGMRHTVGLELTEGRLNVMADVSYNNVEGVMKSSNRNTLSGSMSATYRLRPKFLFRNAMSVTYNNNSDSPYGTFEDYVRMNPYHDPYDSQGNLVKEFEGQTNPLWNARLNTSLTSNYLNFTNNFYAEYSPLQSLRLRLRVGVDTQRDESNRFYPAQHTMFAWMTSEEDMLRRGSYTHGVGRRNYLSGDFTLQYNKQFGRHLIMSNLAYSMGETRSQEISYMAEGFPSDKMNDMMFARGYALNSKPVGRESIVRDASVVGTLGYAYDNRFLADATLRTSASSRYSPDNRWGSFWSIGIGWNVHHEEWARDRRWLERLKLRSSIGSTGSQSVESNLTMTTYNYYTNDFYRTYRPYPASQSTLGAYIMRLANPDLLWQKKFDFNVGFDATISRLSMSFDYYISTTTNLVTQFSLPPSTGYLSISDNAGEVENKGINANMIYRLVSRPGFFMNLTGSFSMNTNTLKKLSDAMRAFNESQDILVDDRVGGGRWKPVLRYIEGGSMTALWAVPSLGINPQNGHEIYVRPDGTTTNTWSPLYQQIVGDSREKYRGNFGFNGEYKGFGLSLTCRFIVGGHLYNSTLVQRVENINIRENVDRRVFEGRWSEDNRFAPFKRLEPYNDADGNYVAIPATQPTSRFVQKRNELDIAAVSAYYDLGRLPAIKDMGFKRLRLGFNMNELHKFSSIKVERGTSYPFARTMSISLSAEF